MASAEEKLKDESKDRQVMGSNANGADGAEKKVEENNTSKDLDSIQPSPQSRFSAPAWACISPSSSSGAVMLSTGGCVISTTSFSLLPPRWGIGLGRNMDIQAAALAIHARALFTAGVAGAGKGEEEGRGKPKERGRSSGWSLPVLVTG